MTLTADGRADTYIRQPAIDIVHYEISVELSDASDSITAIAKIQVRMREESVSGMRLDLAGMQVDSLRVRGNRRTYQYSDGQLSFDFDRPYRRDQIAAIEVRYHGKPERGLLIGKNKYGRRVFFTENWPDHAHYWLPSIDHPSDKATVEIAVTAPAKYGVVSNGRLIEAKPLRNGRKLTRWTASKAIPTYCIALGVAEFSVSHQQNADGVPIAWYSYPEDTESAARKFRPTAEAIAFFSSLIGPYPYEKLAQVQASVSFGGMENSSAIFYKESLIQESPVTEDPVPHEIAHQWFGDSVTQADWDHLWLSEGFATYLEALFHARLYGADALKQTMADSAKRLNSDEMARRTPVIDPTQTDLLKKLNLINYEKGAWVLHMLRGLVGDDTFFQGIRRYYRLHEGGNATSDDFRDAMESVSGGSLSDFFRQWLYQPGWPEYRISWHWNDTTNEVELEFYQNQSTGLFDMPIEVVFEQEQRREARKFRIFNATHSFRIPLQEKPLSVEADPDGWILKSVSIDQF